ncbi:hypothetical protein M408DRAFT_327383 [Serendipita vermifera MAFF 305830]|uniref:Uncharacterized protein n=1 Tax=Serendipita vermifera MAFF 305830 TaxID=933852 RepID=A0A0C3BIT6_SERVB|nr:hypothetical protein M408DRAFT_327383 [Serendipita vermifera MAFF 305830]
MENMENMETTLKRRLSDEYSQRSSDNDIEDVPADVAAYRDMQKHGGFSPTHERGHTTPGHIVGRPIHDSPQHHHQELPAETPPLTHLEQFQEAVLKVVDNKGSVDTLVEPIHRVPGSEPGVDPRRESVKRAYAYIHEACEIEVIDYCAEHVKFRQFDNDSFLEFLKTTDRKPPMKVRWINIAGISWDIISELALKYQLHPLSIEDILHSKSTMRSKADYYQRHLFLSVLCHAVNSKKASPLDAKYFREEDNGSESDSDEEETESEAENETDEAPEEDTKRALLRRVTRRGRKRRSRTKSVDTEAAKTAAARYPSLRWTETMNFLNPEGRKRQAQLAKLNALKKRDRVRVVVSNAFFFLFKDGTLISIHQGDRSFGNQIYHRLRHADTVLRKDPEASLLLQALLDLIVDQTIQVVDKYDDKINMAETQVLLKPSMDIVRTLHILSADLTTRKRAIQPLKPMIWGLRKFDLERTAAAMGADYKGPVEGYMSPKTKVYLSDVSDHLETILSSLDQFATIADNLIDLTFNINAHNTNEQMKRMTILMIVFLPLTFATGYFGMNFKPFPAVDEHTDILFWQIVLPVMAVVLPWAMWGDIRRMFRRIGRMRLLNRVDERQSAKAKTARRHARNLQRGATMKEKNA